MGIYDRDYYRQGPSYLDTLLPSGRVCIWLIALNAAMFFTQVFAPPEQGFPPGPANSVVTKYLILDKDKVLDGQVWRLVTYAFLHASVMHLFFNMLFLWWFGSDLERVYGSAEFLAFYLMAAFLGGLAYFLLALPTGVNAYCLGASGAVTALLVLYAFHFPRQTVLVFFVLPMPIWAFAVFNVVQDTFGMFGARQSNVAFSVHLAGAGFAAIYYFAHWRLLGWWPTFSFARKRSRSRTRLNVFRPEVDETREPVSVSAPTVGSELDEQLEAKLDAVLEKVARHGQHSLTENERQILLKASAIYKRKRS